MIADYSVVDLAFEDRVASKKTLARLTAIPEVECAFLYDASGALFLRTTGATARPNLAHMKIRWFEFDGHFLHVYEPVTEKHVLYGRFICASPPRDSIKRSGTTGHNPVSVGALILLSFLLAIILQKIISRPLLDLAQTTRKISQRQDYSIRVQKSSEDEIGALVTSSTTCSSRSRSVRRIARRRGALRESEYRYRVLVESSPEAVFLEQDGKIVYANARHTS